MRHPDYPRAFTRNRKLPLPALIGALLSMRNQSRQAMLDGFFASVCGSEFLLREVSVRAFDKARNHLHLPALVSLNDLVVRRADEAGLIQRWCGLRVVAGDGSLLMPAVCGLACSADRARNPTRACSRCICPAPNRPCMPSGWSATKKFLRPGAAEAWVTLSG